MAKMFIVSKTAAVKFFASLGFKKAVEWDAEKLIARLSEVPDKVQAEEVTDPKQKEFYDSVITALKDGQSLGLDMDGAKAEEAAEEDAPAEKKSDKAEKPAAKASAKNTKSSAAKPSGKKEAAKASSSKKDTTKPAKAAAKKDAAPKSEKEKDKFGSVLGSKRADVNKAVTSKWQSDEEIMESASSTLRQARSQLRKLKKKGVVEMRRRIEYRLVTDDKKA